MKHHLYRLKSYFSSWNLAKSAPKKNTLVLASRVNTSSSSSHILLIRYCNTWFPLESWYKIYQNLFQFKNKKKTEEELETKKWKYERQRWGKARRGEAFQKMKCILEQAFCFLKRVGICLRKIDFTWQKKPTLEITLKKSALRILGANPRVRFNQNRHLGIRM
jgi:hypothetical protein